MKINKGEIYFYFSIHERQSFTDVLLGSRYRRSCISVGGRRCALNKLSTQILTSVCAPIERKFIFLSSLV